MLASFGSKHAHDSFLSSSLAWVLPAARGSFLSHLPACVASFAFLDLVFMFQPSGLPYFREEDLSCDFRLGHPSCLAGLIIRESPCWSSDCFCCPSEQSPVAFLEVLSAHWLAPIVLLPKRALVDVLVVSWLQSVGLACPCDVLHTCSRCLDLAREG